MDNPVYAATQLSGSDNGTGGKVEEERRFDNPIYGCPPDDSSDSTHDVPASSDDESVTI